MYNCKKANEIPILEVLKKLDIRIANENNNILNCYSPFRDEITPSFKVDLRRNTFYDFGIGYGGRNIDLISKKFNCDVTQALIFFNDNFNSFSFPKQNIYQRSSNEKDIECKIKIDRIVKLSHPALLDYLLGRKISFSKVSEYLVQAYYTVNNKNYFSIAFKNDRGGYELKNKFLGNSNSPKFLTTLKNGSKKVIVTEALFDFLSWVELNYEQRKAYDFIILNSLSFKDHALDLLKSYDQIYLYLDNDKRGKEVANYYVNILGSKVENCANLYESEKDLNAYLMSLSTEKAKYSTTIIAKKKNEIVYVAINR